MERRHQIFTMLQHLNERRNQIEAAVLDTVRKLDAAALESLSRLKRQLAEIEDLIHDYEARLVQHPAAAPDRPARSVFLSSTAIDLQPERKALQDLIEQLQFRFVGMSGFPATGEAPALFIRRMVDESDIYLGILGMRYGSIDTSTGLSMTELEYRQAIAGRKDVRMFVMGDDAPVSVGMIERDPAAFAKLLEFRNLVLQSHMCSIFKDVSDLRKKAENTLKSARQTSGG
ncbi:MAG: DUF4062 domain-containing protein [Dehalococcoidia bacterium]